MKKKVVSVLLAAAMTTTLVAGCGSTGAADTAADTSAEAAEDTEAAETTDTTETATGDTIKVAVVKQMDHASLDEIANAVEEELDAIAAKNGVTIEYETYSGQGDQSVLNQIGTQVVSEDVDVIIPIATLAAQVMANCAEETQTPVVYAAISDPDAAELTGIDYVTGTSDALNTDFIMDMMFKQNPDVQKVGLLYSQSEANSTKPIADAKAYLDEKGIKKAGKSKEVSPEEKIATLEKKVKSLSSKKMMLYSDYKDDKLTREEYVKRSKAMVEQIEGLHQEIEQLKTEIPPEDNSSSKFETQLESIINMESFDREKIQKVIKKVIINGEDNIEIVWNTDDPFFK
mgnify:CR=1 FL=1